MIPLEKGEPMVNGLYTASEGMKLLLNKTEVTSHNLANANTTGFKKSLMLSQSEVLVRRNDEYKLHQDENSSPELNHVIWEKGPLIQTGDPFDVGIEGDGFLAVETPQGTRYTRAGSLTRNASGELVTLGGSPVLDKDGARIVIQGKDLQIGSDGFLSVDNKPLAQLMVVDFADKAGMRRIGGNLWEANAPSEAAPGKDFRIRQGYLEGSNVNTVDSMVELIRYQRNYDANQKVVHSIDETLQKAVNEIGRVQ
jgi:flagellar basal-body rod protein FlgF